MASNLEELKTIELWKGCGFVLLTALILFVIIYTLVRKVRHNEELLALNVKRLQELKQEEFANWVVASLAHDMNNMITIMKTSSELMSSIDNLTESDRAIAQTLYETTDKISALCRRLSDSSKKFSNTEEREFTIEEIVNDILRMVPRHPKASRCTFKLSNAMPACKIRVRGELLQQALLNLLLNAAEATLGEGTVELRIEVKGDALFFEVHDNGPGIPLDQHQVLFQPFHTTKSDGHGLGLMSVKACAQIHDGCVGVGVSDLGGAMFILSLPNKVVIEHEMSLDDAQTTRN
jgi:two-component system sensor histidine kinase HydH